ncbi:MAG TPA: hypoxanthine phosphoribosyltransferase [Balneolales bacterium]|jgi:hypoxanthine phosphoribosyltransferase|nr:hypoxanthine phosphoribosyltransferase [Balneolales bacterium]
MSFYTPEKVICNGDTFREMITKEELQSRIAELGDELSRDFEDKKPIFIGVLNGAFIFLADLMRYVRIPCEVDFLKLSSYGDDKVSSGQVTEKKKLDADIEDRHVILVEDIVDTGLSINYLLNLMKLHRPASVSVVTLLHKNKATRHEVKIDYVGFRIPTKFVLGYGLDFAQEGRNLAQVYVLDENSADKD